MSNYSIRTFSRDSNNMRSANDYINRKKAENLYLVSTTNGKVNNGNKSINSNTPVKTSIGPIGNQRLKSVGGFNVNSYDLFMNITKGRYYTATDGRKIQNYNFVPPNTVETNTDIKINDCSATTFSIESSFNILNIPITQSWDLYEGSYLINRKGKLIDISGQCSCTPNTISSDKDITIVPIEKYTSSGKDITIRSQTKGSLARWNNTNPLRNYNFPQTICMPMPNRKH